MIQTLVTLFGVIALAVLVLYAARRMGVGKPAGPLSLVGKLPLDGRRAIYLVRAGKTVFVVGASEAGLSKLGELGDEALVREEPASASFSQVLARLDRRNVRARGNEASEPEGRE